MVANVPGGVRPRPEMTDDAQLPPEKRLKASGTIEKTSEAAESVVIQTHQETAVLPGKLTTEERLEKNRKFAAEQQNNEISKDFKICPPEKIPLTGVPLTPKNKKSQLYSHTEKISGIRDVGIVSCMGLRKTMEDTDLAVASKVELKDGVHTFELFGIFDGHGGGDASIFVHDHLQKYLIAELQEKCPNGLTDDGIFEALKACFVKIDRDYPGAAGTTANVVLKLNGKLWVANVGDSRALLIKKDGQIVQASEDAKPNNARYLRKIRGKGGYVIFGRVMGELSVARSIGDKRFVSAENERVVSPKPKITNFPCEEIDTIIIACDGLYDVASSNEAGEAVKAIQDESAEMIAKRLVVSAIDIGSNDNVSVVVIKL